ncbi:MAG: FtsW/RodA/SpoVE family cell cycle protein [Puniceicoccales bacterium]|jgi:cell division protein FtsW|nr:FtsW/RodA/SpoVE family cell cycle protein [Puniceicoccales bacterium]
MLSIGKTSREYYRYISKHRWVLTVPLCIIFINILGMIILSSASLSFLKYNYLLRQAIWLLISIIGFFSTLYVPLEALGKNASMFYKFAIMLLILVLIPHIGLSINGSRRWLRLGFSNFQVSEYAKIAFVLYFPQLLSKNEKNHSFTCGFLIPLFHVGIFTFLLLMEPDYGTTALFFLVAMALLFLNGCSAKVLFACGGLASLIFVCIIMLNPVRMARILSFMDLESTKLTGSYQLWQGLIGFNSGGLHGLGLGNGRQQLFYLPEAHTDFIFSVFAEELGYLFSIAIICAYALFFIAAWVETYHIHSPYRFLVANGIMLFLTVQTIVNFCVVMGLLPTKGIALPFMSYGGSHLLFSYIAIGLLLNVFKTSYVNEVLH